MEQRVDIRDIHALAQVLDSCTHEQLLAKTQALPELQNALAQDLLERMARNMDAFRKYLPNIYEQFKNYTPKRSLEFLCTENGIPNLYFPDTKEFLYKANDPQKLCQKQVDFHLEHSYFDLVEYSKEGNRLSSLHGRYMFELLDLTKRQLEQHELTSSIQDVKSCPLCVMLGIGLAYGVGILYERLAIANLIVVEPDSDLFFASLYCFDWANLLEFAQQNQRSIYIAVNTDEAAFTIELSNYFKKHGSLLASFVFYLYHYTSPQVFSVLKVIYNTFKQVIACVGFFDDALTSLSHGISLLQQRIPYLIDDREPSQQASTTFFDEKYSQIPVFIVGNGPSLVNDLDFLRKVQDKAIIIACGSTLLTLYKEGICCDIFMNCERIKEAADITKLIPDKTFLANMLFVGSDVLHPDNFLDFKRSILLTKSDEPFFALASIKLGEEFQQVQVADWANPYVANLALSFVRRVPFKHIYMFGIDNGTKVREQLHNTKSVYESGIFSKELIKYLNKDLTTNDMYQGNFGGKVYSDFTYSYAADCLGKCCTRALAENVGFEFINCSDGLKIEGTKAMHSAELLEQFLALPDKDVNVVIDFIYEQRSKVLDLDLSTQAIDSLLDKETFNYLVDKLSKFLASLGTAHANNEVCARLDLVMRLESVCEYLYDVYNSRHMYLAMLLMSSLNTMFVILMQSLYRIKEEQEAITCTRECLERIVYFLEDAKRYYAFMPDCFASDYLKHFNGKIGFDHEHSKAPEQFTGRLVEPHKFEEFQQSMPSFIKRYA